MNEQPAIGGRAPLPIEVTAGEEYWWCACGHSKSQPFCDGSHEGTPFEPKQYVAPESKRVFFCTCKRTRPCRSATARTKNFCRARPDA